jgi:hypothetical protein
MCLPSGCSGGEKRFGFGAKQVGKKSIAYYYIVHTTRRCGELPLKESKMRHKEKGCGLVKIAKKAPADALLARGAADIDVMRGTRIIAVRLLLT